MNDPAFPGGDFTACEPTYGMTLRDWFAGRAIQAAWEGMDKGYFEGGNEEIATCAYQIADAMLVARKDQSQ